MRGGIEAPRLITDNAYGALGNSMMKYSQDGLDYNQRQRAFDEQVLNSRLNRDYQNKVFDHTVNQDTIKNGQVDRAFTEQQNQNTANNTFRDKQFKYQVGQDLINNNFKRDELQITKSRLFRPDYATFNGVDANGNPTLSMIDKNSGNVVNTGQQVYNESKKLAPEQSLYYMDRANEMKQKQLTEMEKNFRATNEFSNLNEADQLKAIDSLRATGKIPQISHDNSWFGKGYYLPQNGNSAVDIKALEEAINKL